MKHIVIQTSVIEKKGGISGVISDLNRQFDSTLKTHEDYERQIAILENRIVELTSISNPSALPTEWWNRFSS